MQPDENPYRAPVGMDRAVGVLSGKREDLRKVAVAQKGIMVCILVYLVAIALVAVLQPSPLVRLLLIVPLILASAGFTIMLAMQVYGMAGGILMGILALVPCMGLLVLLLINARATKVLRSNGIQVGLLGADLSRV